MIIKKILLFVFCIFLSTTSCFAGATKQVLMGGDAGDALNTVSVEYASLLGTKLWNATEFDPTEIVPCNGVLSEFRVHLTSAPGAGTYTFALLVATAQAGTPGNVSVAMTDTTVDAVDSVNTAAVIAGQRVVVRCTPTGSPSAANASFTFIFTPTITDEAIVMSTHGNQLLTANTTNYLAPMGAYIPKATESFTYQIAPYAGTIKKLYVLADSILAAGEQLVFTVRDDAANTTVTTTLSAGEINDNSGALSATVAAGSLLSVSCVSSGGAVEKVRVSFVVVPDTSGYFPFMFHTEDLMFKLINGYNTVIDGNSIWATEANKASVTHAFTAKNIYVWLSAAPGAGGSTDAFDIYLQDDAVSTALTVKLLEVETTDNYATDVSIADASLIDTLSDPTSNPTGDCKSAISYTGYIKPRRIVTEG